MVSLCRYEELDPYGVWIGMCSFILATSYAFFLLKKYHLNLKSICYVLILSALGHFIGAYALFEFAVNIGADSCFYFANATTKYQGMGYWFAFMILGYAKEYLLGESFLGSFLISGALALIGSTYLFVTYKFLLDKISGKYRYYLIDHKQLVYPAILLMCWPSYFFWSAGIVKDNFSFLSITMILFILVRSKFSVGSLLHLTLAGLIGFMSRPYLFVIFAVSGFIYTLLGSRLKLQYKIIILSLLVFCFSMLSPILNQYGSMVHYNGSDTLRNIGEYAIRQQGYMAIGSSIPVPTNNPYLVFLFIPWLVFANLLLPLGFGASSLIGVVSSVENAYLLWWVIWFLRHRSLWKSLSHKVPLLKFLMIYFLFGMMCLSIMCTNLGLAMREKMMYAPALLICMFLTYAYRRILIQNHDEQEQHKKQDLALSIHGISFEKGSR